MIRQVRLHEKYLDDGMPPVERSRRVFAFGSHELATAAEAHAVMSASALNGASANALRVILDEILVGNHIEEIACRGSVDDDALARVPVGATPDDVTRCAAANDVLPARCPASNPLSMCICANPAGCIRGSDLVPEGEPVGILDIDQDGAADETRMIPGAIAIRCGAGGAIDVPIDLDLSYWNPSGDQNKPARGGFDALGPAIVLTPTGALPTNVDCGLVFDGSVVDKQGEQVCAPVNGDIAEGCTPGETGAFTFGVEPMVIRPLTFVDGQTGTDRMSPVDFSVNVPVDMASIAGITIVPATVGVTVTLLNPRTIRISGTLDANTLYTVTFPTTVTDGYAQPLPAMVAYTFTTGT